MFFVSMLGDIRKFHIHSVLQGYKFVNLKWEDLPIIFVNKYNRKGNAVNRSTPSVPPPFLIYAWTCYVCGIQ